MKRSILFLLIMPVLMNAQDVAVTVYNQNRALVREVRKLEIARGDSRIDFKDVAGQMDPTSVHFKSLDQPDKLTIHEQNFEYDLVSAQKILQKYVDANVQLVARDGTLYSGILLSAGREDVVLKKEEGGIQILRMDQIQHYDFPELPQGLITRPTLVWQVENRGKSVHRTEISYLTTGMGWHAEYVAVVGPRDKRLDLAGWVSIENQCGATFKDAKLKLVAGDVNMVSERPERNLGLQEDRMLVKSAGAPFEEKSFFEYHLYTLQRPTTLKNHQTKQVSLFPEASTPAKKIFLYEGGDKIKVNMEFSNSQKAGLGLPLPKGKIRVYKKDTDGALEFIGEDRIDHTPKDEDVTVFMGNAFDLKGERVVKNSRKISQRSREDEISISLRNHKDEAVTIVVRERLWGDWTIVNSNFSHKKKDAATLEFIIPVPADGEVELVYSARIKW